VSVANPEGRFILVNEAFCRITGYSEAELLSRDWISITHPDDRQHSLSVRKQMETGELPGALVETRFIRKDGATIRVRNSTSLLQENGHRQCAISLVEDVTEDNRSSGWGVECSIIDPERVEKMMRDDEQCFHLVVGEDTQRMLSARLIRAQEEERKRVARELHDGVTQTLGAISIELARTAEAATGSHVAQRLSSLYARLQEVVTEIGHISHELHPSTLRHVGLSLAIKNLCREVSETHGIAVEVTDSSGAAPQVSKDVALCLYRVAQEALQNIVKHSRSTRAWVELQGSSEEVALFIRDKGVGFRVEPLKGLGLVSMRERLRLVGGTIAIHSRIGAGTRIEAHVPLRSALSTAA
jgi:PAS domain S-box-containing protein